MCKPYNSLELGTKAKYGKFWKFLLPNKAVIFLKIFREIYICPKEQRGSEAATEL